MSEGILKNRIFAEKVIIALKGAGKRGKSSTIKKACEILVKQYGNCQDPKTGVAIKESIFAHSKGDITVLIEANGIKVGIESQGDPNGKLQKSLKLFADIGCQLIICATRTSGMTVDWVEEQKEYKVIWKIQKGERAKDAHDIANSKMADEIVAEVVKIIKAYQAI